jgi:hypothetical protein
VVTLSHEEKKEFLKLDEAGDLGAAFGPGAGAEPDVVAVVEAEEGWILGV